MWSRVRAPPGGGARTLPDGSALYSRSRASTRSSRGSMPHQAMVAQPRDLWSWHLYFPGDSVLPARRNATRVLVPTSAAPGDADGGGRVVGLIRRYGLPGLKAAQDSLGYGLEVATTG